MWPTVPTQFFITQVIPVFSCVLSFGQAEDHVGVEDRPVDHVGVPAGRMGPSHAGRAVVHHPVPADRAGIVSAANMLARPRSTVTPPASSRRWTSTRAPARLRRTAAEAQVARRDRDRRSSGRTRAPGWPPSHRGRRPSRRAGSASSRTRDCRPRRSPRAGSRPRGAGPTRGGTWRRTRRPSRGGARSSTKLQRTNTRLPRGTSVSERVPLGRAEVGASSPACAKHRRTAA